MGSTGTVRLQDIFDMLDLCAPGNQREQKTHNWIIKYAGKTYAKSFPLGPHGKRHPKSVMVELGHVRSLVRFFGIQDCARGQLPQL